MSPARRVATLAGIVLVAGSVAVAALLLYDLVRIGNCGSDGVHYSGPPCPPGTGAKVAGMIAAIFVVPFAGLGLIAWGRAAPGPAVSVGVTWFFLLFTAMGVAALVAGDGPASIDDGNRGGSRWVAGTFLVMGAPALLVILAFSVRRWSRR